MKGIIIFLIIAGGAIVGGAVVSIYLQAVSLPNAREEERQFIRAEPVQKFITSLRKGAAPMRMFRNLMKLLWAASLAACGATASVVDGSGFEALKPSTGTRAFIVANDRPFADQVVRHNRT